MQVISLIIFRLLRGDFTGACILLTPSALHQFNNCQIRFWDKKFGGMPTKTLEVYGRITRI